MKIVTVVTVTGVTFLMSNTSEDQFMFMFFYWLLSLIAKLIPNVTI